MNFYPVIRWIWTGARWRLKIYWWAHKALWRLVNLSRLRRFYSTSYKQRRWTFGADCLKESLYFVIAVIEKELCSACSTFFHTLESVQSDLRGICIKSADNSCMFWDSEIHALANSLPEIYGEFDFQRKGSKDAGSATYLQCVPTPWGVLHYEMLGRLRN